MLLVISNIFNIRKGRKLLSKKIWGEADGNKLLYQYEFPHGIPASNTVSLGSTPIFNAYIVKRNIVRNKSLPSEPFDVKKGLMQTRLKLFSVPDLMKVAASFGVKTEILPSTVLL
ncbi:hypothetical protein AVEN_217039-1 [Araneus ventricosus]|uniref:Uncharacterized protein n=1 Tax=Araneus ventricosus TaxID=182803 RepID=A0A4Y2S101_ARAVE|nr:hypothetical protein AVEN_217039-1 [Araneus ventricosus]